PARDITNTPNEQEFLEDIDGSHVVWTHSSALSPGDVVLYDVAKATQLTVAPSSVGLHFEQPQAKGRYITFVRVQRTQSDIDGYDMLLGWPFSSQVTSDAAKQASPRLNGDVIVYEDYNSGNADVFGWKISTSGPAFAIATGASNQASPDVDAAHVVWLDDA